MDVGRTNNYTNTLTVNSGTLSISNVLALGDYDSSRGNGTLYMNNGLITGMAQIWVGDGGNGIIEMSGGEIVVNWVLAVPQRTSTSYSGTGLINLRGGRLTCNQHLSMTAAGKINIEGGTLVIGCWWLDAATEQARIEGYISSSWITAYNGDPRAQIIVTPSSNGQGGTKFTLTAVRNSSSAAINPIPTDWQENVVPTQSLQWTCGNGAVQQYIYIGTDRKKVLNVNSQDQTGILRACVSGDITSYSGGNLAFDTAYHWRVDDVNSSGVVTKGEVWSFSTASNAAIATKPSPYSTAKGVGADIKLRWKPGSGAVGHDVYLGRDYSVVQSATTSSAGIYKGNYSSDANSYDPGGLAAGTYYWRVDECGGSNTWKGYVWRFTVADYGVMDNFESYTGTSISASWVVKGGASLSLESNIINNGVQSAKLQYSNSSQHTYSEIGRSFSTAQDWTSDGRSTLALFFRGSAVNTPEYLYVALSDGQNEAIVTYADVNGPVQKSWERWQVWYLDLRQFSDHSVNLQNIKKITVGTGNRYIFSGNTSGTIYLDDIRRYKLVEKIRCAAQRRYR